MHSYETNPVALRLQDRTRAMMDTSHLVGCVAEKSKGAKAYLVHRASSFVPEIQKTVASARLAWTFDEVCESDYPCPSAPQFSSWPLQVGAGLNFTYSQKWMCAAGPSRGFDWQNSLFCMVGHCHGSKIKTDEGLCVSPEIQATMQIKNAMYLTLYKANPTLRDVPPIPQVDVQVQPTKGHHYQIDPISEVWIAGFGNCTDAPNDVVSAISQKYATCEAAKTQGMCVEEQKRVGDMCAGDQGHTNWKAVCPASCNACNKFGSSVSTRWISRGKGARTSLTYLHALPLTFHVDNISDGSELSAALILSAKIQGENVVTNNTILRVQGSVHSTPSMVNSKWDAPSRAFDGDDIRMTIDAVDSDGMLIQDSAGR